MHRASSAAKRSDEALSAYVVLREINRILDREGIDAAIAYARSQWMQNPSLALAYRLATLCEQAGDRAGQWKYSSSFAGSRFLRRRAGAGRADC